MLGRERNEMKNHRLKRIQFCSIFLIPAVVTMGWAAAVWKGAPLPLLVIGIILVLVAWFTYITIPYQFAYIAGETICFQSAVRNVRVEFQDISSVDVMRWNRGFVTIRCVPASITLFRNMPGIKALVTDIQRCNPSVKVRGSM